MKSIKYHYTIVILLVVVLLTAIPVQYAMANWTYWVRPGDTLWNIARRTGKSTNSIRSASGLSGNKINPGQKLIIPSNSGNGISSSDRELLARLVEAEAAGEPYKGKVSVAAVVLNRVKDSRFPNTIKGVIYQRHAFESVSNGLIWRRTPGKESYNAVNDALNGWDPTYRSVFFWNPYKRVSSWIWSRPIVTQYGSHVFAR